MSVGIQDALAKLYLKLGGDPDKIKENKNVTDYLDDLGDVFKSLIELPIVNSTDNDKILKVINGKWDKALIQKELPDTTAYDEGKVFGISPSGSIIKQYIFNKEISASLSSSDVLNVNFSSSFTRSNFFDSTKIKGVSKSSYIKFAVQLHDQDAPISSFTTELYLQSIMPVGAKKIATFIGYAYDSVKSKYFKVTLFVSSDTSALADAYKIEEISLS